MDAAGLAPVQLSLPALKEAAAGCQACDLWERGTQTVFGEGRTEAELMLLGEQPGDREDVEGQPFVGPAGRLLDEALAEAGIDRGLVYVTNVVKHFKWVPKGKRRIHQKPNQTEIRACRPWLEAEVTLIRPRLIVCLGATAARAVLGADFKVTRRRGELLPTDLGPDAVATVHPSSILRAPDDRARREAYEGFVGDLRRVAGRLRGSA